MMDGTTTSGFLAVLFSGRAPKDRE